MSVGRGTKRADRRPPGTRSWRGHPGLLATVLACVLASAAALALFAAPTSRTPGTRDPGGLRVAAGTIPGRALRQAPNLVPRPDFTTVCSSAGLDESTACLSAELAATDAARAAEGLPELDVSAGPFLQLTPAEQLFVLTDLERTSRGLPPFVALLPSLDALAAKGAAAETDPRFEGASPMLGSAPVVQWGSNWAGATFNPLGADYYWTYDDGPGGPNIDCTPTDRSGCYAHRENVLTRFSPSSCPAQIPLTLVMGAAVTEAGRPAAPSLAELLAGACSPSLSGALLTWPEAEQLLGLSVAPTRSSLLRRP